jgi:hypothetical protein
MTERDYCVKEKDLAEIRVRLDAAFERIDELRKLHELLYELSSNVSVLVEQMKDTKVDITSLKGDMEILKRKPVDDYNGYQRMIFGGIIGAIIAFMMSQILP